MKLVVLALVLIAAPGAARAEMPNYDVEAHCRQVGQVAGGSQEMENFCLRQEQSAYDSLKPVWDGLPASLRSHCDQVAQMAGGSFEMLKFCVGQEIKAARANQRFHFQR